VIDATRCIELIATAYGDLSAAPIKRNENGKIALRRLATRSTTTTLEQMMKKVLSYVTAASCLVAFISSAQARSAHDGAWDLLFVTQRGTCNSTYNFSVNISNGVVTHPNLVRFKGYVARSGAVRASVTVQDRYASGSGRLSSNSGHGTWSGYSGSARCSGYWTAARN
jgi:hypothetical protein